MKKALNDKKVFFSRSAILPLQPHSVIYCDEYCHHLVMLFTEFNMLQKLSEWAWLFLPLNAFNHIRVKLTIHI